MTRLFLLMCAVALAGCGATIKASSPRSVIVKAAGVSQAQPMADAECAKHNRFARFSARLDAFVYSFDCSL